MLLTSFNHFTTSESWIPCLLSGIHYVIVSGRYLIQVCGTNDFSEVCDEVDIVAQNPIEGASITSPPVCVSGYLATISINYQILPTSPQPCDIYLHFKTDLNNLEGNCVRWQTFHFY